MSETYTFEQASQESYAINGSEIDTKQKVKDNLLRKKKKTSKT